ncbi:MAG: hypothetical protein RIQ54_229 [Candidatus Parcubacteria bacterium]|jgi:predicted PurR-regulated permease PerM
MQRNVFDISWISLWRILFFLIFASILYFSQQIILGLFLAIVISAGLDFMVDFLERRGIPRSFGVVIIFLSTLLAIVFLLYTVVPFLIADLNTVLSKFNRPVATYWLGPLVNFQPDRSIALFVSRISTQLFSGNFSPISTFSDVLGGLGLAIAVLFSSFYLSLNRDGIERFIRAVLPDAYEDQAIEIYRRSRRKMGVWFQTQLILSFIVGMLVYVALLVLGLQHAFILAFLAGLFELVPFVGPIVAGGLAIISAWTVSPILAFYTLLVFLAIHQLESHVLVPLLTRRSVGLHPVLVIIALLIGLELGGLLGAFVAIPAAAVIQEIVEFRSARRHLPDEEEVG